jgi:hypothetical protein
MPTYYIRQGKEKIPCKFIDQEGSGEGFIAGRVTLGKKRKPENQIYAYFEDLTTAEDSKLLIMVSVNIDHKPSDVISHYKTLDPETIRENYLRIKNINQ